MKLNDAKIRFQLDTRMFPILKNDFSSDPKFTEDQWKCEMCLRIDTINHIKLCPGYEDLRVGMNLNKDEDLEKYFKAVLESSN